MTKKLKTAAELESYLMLGSLKEPECQGLTGISIQPIADDRSPYNWTVEYIHNGTPQCGEIVARMVVGLQLVFDLKK